MSSIPTRFNKAHSDKPDPEEPWRYVCPDCHGQVSEWGGLKYKCSSCGKNTQKDNLYDQKTGKKFRELI